MAALRPCLLLAAALGALTPAAAREPADYEMTTYQLALLRAADGATPLAPGEVDRRQAAHEAFLEDLVRSGMVVLTGPLADAAPLRGLVVLDAGSLEEARALMEQDPWIVSGHVALEIHPWWAARGILRRPPTIADLEPCWLGLLRRPADAPDFSQERLAELQAGHMANMQAMADSGHLVIAGPMGDDTPLRGLFLFRDAPREQVEDLVARDPAVAAGRLEVELLRLRLPRGTLPPRETGP